MRHPPQGKTLSELVIDKDKNWRGKGITNIAHIANGMTIGHIAQKIDAEMVTLAPGVADWVLTSQGPGKPVTWAPGGMWWWRYLPQSLYLLMTAGIVVPNATKAILLPIGTSLENQLTPTLSPQLGLSFVKGKITPDAAEAVNSPMTTDYYLEMLLDGCVAHYGDPAPSDHDELAESRSDTADDIHLPPQYAHDPPDEYILLGNLIKFDAAYVYVSTAGVGNYAVQSVKYWDGDSWEIPAGLVDNLNDFQATGISWAEWTIPGDWALLNVLGYNLYWIQIACSAMVSLTTPPLGKNAWVRLG